MGNAVCVNECRLTDFQDIFSLFKRYCKKVGYWLGGWLYRGCMTEVAVGMCSYWQRHQYSVCVTRLCVPVVHRNVLSFCLKPVQNLVCLAEEFLSRFSCITRANQICVYKNLHQNQSQKQQPLTLLSVFRPISCQLLLLFLCVTPAFWTLLRAVQH